MMNAPGLGSWGWSRPPTTLNQVKPPAEWHGITLGLCKIGVVSALINFNLRQEALAHCIRISKCSAVVFSPSLSDALCTVLPDLDAAMTDSCYSVSGEASLPQAKALNVELQSSSPHPPSPPPNKAFEGKHTILPNECAFALTSETLS